MSDPHLSIEALSAGYGRRRIIEDLTLPAIEAGAITALVGPNAAGKSTLLRALAGLVSAAGRAMLAGENLLRQSLAERARNVVFMPQSLPQGVGLTVLESVIGALSLAWPDAAAGQVDQRRRAVRVLERLGIVALALERLDTLSGGQRQMVALAQALAREPRVLLLDEPTSALDLRHQEIVMGAAASLAAEGRIVLVVLHDLTLAARWAERVIVLDAGRVKADAAPAEALTSRVLADVYGVHARVERTGAGRLHIDVTGAVAPGET